MASLLGFGWSLAPSGNRETTTTPTTAALRAPTRPRQMALVHPNREVLGLEGAHLLDVDADVHP
jgi:hypothetical protein